MCECRIIIVIERNEWNGMNMEKGWKMKENVRTKANKRLERRRSMGYVMVG